MAERMTVELTVNGRRRQLEVAVHHTLLEVLRDDIDLKLRTDLRRFADARESMVHLFGLQAYADIMSSFAAGERYINRVWSASADGYGAEASTYIEKAAKQFADAQSLLLKAAEGTA